MPQAIAALPDDPETLKAMLTAERARSERLVQIIKEMQRHRFGRRAETLPEDQMLLALEDAEQTEGGASAEAEARSAQVRAEAARRRRRNRGALPAHLPRIETTVDIEDKTCPCCKGLLHRIGEDVVVQAPAPPRLIKGGMPTEATVAHVLVSKYADHLPLYRQARIYDRQGINLDRSTLADWVGRAAWHLCQWRAESPQFWRRKIPQSGGFGDQPFGRSRPPFLGGLPRRRRVGGMGAGWILAFVRMCSGRRSACARSR